MLCCVLFGFVLCCFIGADVCVNVSLFVVLCCVVGDVCVCVG